MASMRDVLAELNHKIDWHHAQLGCGLDAKTCADRRMQSLLSRVRSFGTISTDDATQLVSAIWDNALPDWSPDQIAEICASVGERTGGLTNATEKNGQDQERRHVAECDDRHGVQEGFMRSACALCPGGARVNSQRWCRPNSLA
eukprot:7621187-Pyramimonas_sp.AAC.1